MALGAIPFPNVSENLARCDVYDANSRGNAKYSRDAIRVFRDTNGEHCDCAVRPRLAKSHPRGVALPSGYDIDKAWCHDRSVLRVGYLLVGVPGDF